MYQYERPDSWYEIEYTVDVWQEEIDNLRVELLKKLSQIVTLNYVETFANILYYAFFELEDFAVKLCDEWNIRDRHFYAFKNEKEKLIDCFKGNW